MATENKIKAFLCAAAAVIACAAGAAENNAPWRFRLLGSDDGKTWTELDARSIGEKKIKRNAWTGPYSPLRGESFTAHPMLTRDGRRILG